MASTQQFIQYFYDSWNNSAQDRRAYNEALAIASEKTGIGVGVSEGVSTIPGLPTFDQLSLIGEVATNPPNPQIDNNVPVPPPAAGVVRDPAPVSDSDAAINGLDLPPPAINGLDLPAPVPDVDTQYNRFVFDQNGELIPADSVLGQEIIQREIRIENTQANDIGGNFTETYNPETGKFDVFDLDTGVVVASGLTEQEAILQAQERSVGDPGYGLPPGQQGPVPRTQAEQRAEQAATLQAAKDRARVQSTLQAQQNQASQGDWRVKLRLAPGAQYLYRGADGQGVQAGILKPLADTDGVVFPYTPGITTNYKANYNAYDLTHSNYRGYFYQGSHVEAINITALFTAQDTVEANYLLAVIHFFRSVTKMFYGQDDQFRGAPPPLVFLQGLGQYQFNLHPCVVTTFTYNLPSDVDYIRADVNQISGNNFQIPRQRKQDLPTNPFSGALARLAAAGLPKGGVNIPPAPTQLGTQSPTYVPTRIEIQLELFPIQSRQQVSREFSLEKFGNGNLQRAGFW